jgi:hypothetical protein
MTKVGRNTNRSLASLARGVYVRSQLVEWTNHLDVTISGCSIHRSKATILSGIDISPQHDLAGLHQK